MLSAHLGRFLLHCNSAVAPMPSTLSIFTPWWSSTWMTRSYPSEAASTSAARPSLVSEGLYLSRRSTTRA
ncbi:uncharacterized protein B0I36DRAFT_331883 [Microdochium trichocladiopsis]|uniref:Uncharacterized protein n=1 Tax=Microdochium trichocladiopsis TaxID=1682393 RepID=A0A9P9BLA7_9PEZI|nr:uncharacterized protein B0I36DRAFT_331883 [Microdochium trichocladiopsis]KAH7024699.1 hypothetical protein B0I36DRAFT_331883 [Microdochium trichocladiopsis]